ncbi:acyltransferase [Paenibacillus sp. 3LSP]|uniref:acyltransferase n=1 Tax=Paenibacillus sp. 3LSP TaxID=2800795 RepID=UPI0028FD20A5|nr:acyltransferase [Paenibacillus sp. 3LSP]MDU0332807.1 acyltransferase [Paenibacillus sp. 3LSP]
MERKTKLEEIEALRGIAFLAVVLQHAIAGLFVQPDMSPLSVGLGTTFLGLIRFAVPLFVFITGVVLFYNYDRSFQYGRFLKRRGQQVVLPYLFWTVFYYIWVSLRSGDAIFSSWKDLLHMLELALTGKASYHLWFMVMIIPFYLLFPVFRQLLSGKRPAKVNLFVTLAFLTANLLLLEALRKGVFQSDQPILHTLYRYLDRNFLFWTFYFVLGGLVGLYYERWKKAVRSLWGISLVLTVLFLIDIGTKIAAINQGAAAGDYLTSANVTGPLKPLMLWATLAMLPFLFYGVQRLLTRPTKAGLALSLIGKYSFGAYLVHAFILRYTNLLALNYLGGFGVYAQILISFILCACVSISLCIGYRKMRDRWRKVQVGADRGMAG